MKKQKSFIVCFLLAVVFFFNCGIMRPKWKSIELTGEDIKTSELLNIEQPALKKLKAKPLFQFTPQEVDVYLGYLQSIEPNLRLRIQHLARKCLGQPYQIFLLGEFPYEIYDPDPMFSLDKSDCVVFSEHIYSMALSYDWKSFFAMLQRIRYKNGEVGMATRNHYTEFDWDVNNRWLVEDMTEELAGDNVVYQHTFLDRSRFLSRWGITTFAEADTISWSYIPLMLLPEIIAKLQPGDFVNIVRGYEDNKWVGHVGLITVGEDGTRYFLHSTPPKVKEQRLMELYETAAQYNSKRQAYNEKIEFENQKILVYNQKLREENGGKRSPKEKRLKNKHPYFYGFKFLRLREDPIWELMKIDGPFAPKVEMAPVFD